MAAGCGMTPFKRQGVYTTISGHLKGFHFVLMIKNY